MWCYICRENVTHDMKSTNNGLVCVHHTRDEIAATSPTPPDDDLESLEQNRQMAGIFAAFRRLPINEILTHLETLRRRSQDEPRPQRRDPTGEKIRYLELLVRKKRQERGQIRKPFYKSRK